MEREVNSTRGNSVIDPVNYKGDVLVQVWIDSRVLATLCRWLEDNEDNVRFMSQVVKKPLEVLVEHLTDKGEVVMVDDTTEARSFLSRKFGINLNRGDKGKKNTLHNIVLSDMRGEISDRVGSRKVNDVCVPKVNNSKIEELKKKAMEKYIELYGNPNQSKPSVIYSSDNHVQKVQTVISGNDTESIIVEGASDEELAKHIESKDAERMRKEREFLMSLNPKVNGE